MTASMVGSKLNHPGFGISRPIKLAVLGGGLNSAVGRAHYSALMIDGLFECGAGCFSRDLKLNQKTARAWGVAENHTFASIDSLINSDLPGIDGYLILTPTNQHFQQISDLANTGIPIICEKAITTSANLAAQASRTVSDNGVPLYITFNYLGYPMVREMREIISSGSLGRPLQMEVNMPQEGFLRPQKNGRPAIPQEWRLSDEEIPTVSLDLGVHVYSLVQFILRDEVTEVVAVEDSFGPHQVIDSVQGVGKTTLGVTVSFSYSKISLGNRNGLSVKLYCERGSLEWKQVNAESLRVTDMFGTPRAIDRGSYECLGANDPIYQRFKVGHPAGFIEAFANYYFSIVAKQWPDRIGGCSLQEYILDVDDAVRGIKFLDTVHSSSVTKSWRTVP